MYIHGEIKFEHFFSSSSLSPVLPGGDSSLPLFFSPLPPWYVWDEMRRDGAGWGGGSGMESGMLYVKGPSIREVWCG